MKDYYQKWMKEKAQSLTGNTAAAFQQKRYLYPFSCRGRDPPSPRLPDSPCPGMRPVLGDSPMMSMMGPPLSGTMPMGHVPRMRPQMEGHVPTMPGLPRMRPLPCSLMMLTQPGMAWLDR